MTALLIQLIWKNTTWNFDSSYYKVFNTLRKIFTFALILIYWIPNAQMIVKTNTLECALIAILSIMTEEKEVHPVIFYSCSFKTIELNYNTYDKELFVVFEVFHTWCYYLEGLKQPINIITDYKNLKYFLITKILFYFQARWLEFLSQFNSIIWFCLKCLKLNPDTIIYRKDLYPREGKAMYNFVNLYNMYSIFTHNQLITSLWATTLISLNLWTTTIIDLNGLYSNMVYLITISIHRNTSISI